MSANRILLDGRYATGFYAGREVVSYPFRSNGDTRSLIVTRQWRVRSAYYYPATLGVARDPVYADAFLIAESDPQPAGIGDVVQTTRIFARVPEEQRTPGTIVVSKPQIPGSDALPAPLGDYLVTQPDTTLPRYDAYRRQTVTSDTGLPAFYPTGGTYTLSFGGDTTGSLNYNDSAATIETALDALTSVTNRGGVTCSGSYNSAGGIVVTFANYAQITIDASSLTGETTSPIKIETLTNGGYTQSVGAYFADTGIVPSPTFPGPDLLLTYTGGSYNISPTFSGDDLIVEFNASPGVFTGGTFKITLDGATTAAIAYNATFSTVASELNALGGGRYYDVVGNAFSGATTIFSASGATLGFTVKPRALGGTFTLTVGADTTGSLNYNDSAATVQTALNLLTSVTNRGGCTVSGTLANGFAIAFSNAAITANSSSLTPAGSTVTGSVTDSGIGRLQKLTYASPLATRDIYIASHGITAGQTLFVYIGTSYVYPITDYIVPDANTIRFTVAAGSGLSSASAITQAGARTKANYQPGSIRVRGFRVSRFYLPGITPGITTASDIPIPTSAANDVDFLLAVFAGSTALNVDVGELEKWRDGPILSISASEVSAADL